MVQAVLLADWLEELAVYSTARRPQSTETAYQLSLVVKNWYLVSLALNLRRGNDSMGRRLRHSRSRTSGSVARYQPKPGWLRVKVRVPFVITPPVAVCIWPVMVPAKTGRLTATISSKHAALRHMSVDFG
jgi:hypothetical protein